MLYLILLISGICVDLIFSFLAAVWETSLTTTPIYKWENVYHDKKQTFIYKIVLQMIKRYDISLGAALIVNNIANVTCSVLVTLLIQATFDQWFLSISTGILTAVMITFCEYMPKILAKKYPIFWLRYTGIGYYFFFIIFYPISLLYSIVFMGRNKNITATESEVQSLLKVLKKEKVIDESEKNLAINALRFDDINSHMAITDDYIKIDYRLNIDQLAKTINENDGDKYFIVFKKDKVVGSISAKNVIGSKSRHWHRYIKHIHKFNSNVRLNVLYKYIKNRKVQIIIIKNKSNFVGIVTYHSLIECLFCNVDEKKK